MFVLGQGYTRSEIHAELGGSRVSCLPMRGGRIVAACLTRDFSPQAPDVVLCGQGQRTGPTSAVLTRQRGAIPVFVKRAASCWEFRGLYEVKESLSAGVRFERYIAGSGRTVGSVSYVVLLEPVDAPHRSDAASLASKTASARHEPADSLQRAIHEPVELVAYSAAWPSLFAAERDRLAALFPTRLLAIEHIGSTAVPGLPAKPVIDLLAGVASMASADALVEPLLASGYTTSREFNATLPDRRWFMRFADGRRTHHLHVVVLGGGPWNERLRFRDRLRADAALAQAYAQLKSGLAETHRDDREAYTAAKSAFIAAVVADV